MTAIEQKTVQQISTKQAVMEVNQSEMSKLLEKLDRKLDTQAEQLDTLNRKFDELTGAKKFLVALTGFALTIAGLIIAFIHNNK